MFCDYLNVYQQHDSSYGDYLGGRVVSILGDCGLRPSVVVDDETGELKKAWAFSSADFDEIEVDYSIGTFAGCTGSYETKLFIRMIAGRVEVRGNPSSYGRRDNLFGVTIDEGIEIYNQVLESLGLPCFTAGEIVQYWREDKRKGKGEFITEYTGAILTRVDCTQNLAVGMGNVQNFNKWALSQKLYRTAPDDVKIEQFARWSFDTVYLSESKYWLGAKLYDKGKALMDRTLPEYRKKLSAAVSEGRLSRIDSLRLLHEMENYLDRLALWCAEIGIVRAEWTFKNRWFKQSGKAAFWIPNETQGVIMGYAFDELEKLTGRAVVYQSDAEQSLTNVEFRTLSQWKTGVDVKEQSSKPTFYRLRAAILKKTGFDIAARPLAVTQQSRPVYFNVRPLVVSSAPSWYERPVLLAA